MADGFDFWEEIEVVGRREDVALDLGVVEGGGIRDAEASFFGIGFADVGDVALDYCRDV